jgi:hypothetical protein
MRSTENKDSPHSEEQQGRHLAQAALEAGVQCFVWSTLPSSREMSGGRFVSMIYEGLTSSLLGYYSNFMIDLTG